MLEITGLSKWFGSVAVFAGLSFVVPRKQTTVLLGPSGCGKSTLLDVLMGLVPPEEGTIRWEACAVPSLAGRGVYMQQKDLLLPWKTLEENALLPVAIRRRVGTEDREGVRSLLRQFGLSGFESAFPGNVSGGMRQRCALVRTLVAEGDVVLLDEPLSALDARTRAVLRRELERLPEEFGRTVLLVTHDPEDALALGDWLVVLSARPMAVREVLEIASPHPREWGSPTLESQRRYLLKLLLEERE